MTGPQDVRAAAGWPARDPALAVACPVAYCRRQPGVACQTPTGRQLREPHPSRAAAAGEAS